jgi:hypothetical protein
LSCLWANSLLAGAEFFIYIFYSFCKIILSFRNLSDLTPIAVAYGGWRSNRSTAVGPTGGKASRLGSRRLRTIRRAPRRQAQPLWTHNDRVSQTSCATAASSLKTALKQSKYIGKNIFSGGTTNQPPTTPSHQVAVFFAQNRSVGLEPQPLPSREASLCHYTTQSHVSILCFFSLHIIPRQV